MTIKFTMRVKQLLSKLDPNLYLLLLLSLFAWAPLLTPAYFFNAHDAKHSIFFLVEFDQTFRQWEAICRDPKATDAQAKAQWELVEVAETKLKWWQSKTVGDPPYASRWE